jgi:hypothetical protein
MRLNMPLADPVLLAMDRFVGLNWPSFIRLIDGSAILSETLRHSYNSAFLQLALVPPAVSALGHSSRGFRTVYCYVLLCVMATTVATFFPSVGAYGGYNFDTATLTNVDASNGFGFLTGFEGVRTDPNFVLGAKTASGIVTFPSVHAGVAALMAWAAWPTALRYPVLALNFLMAVATVSHGAHYFVDIPAGLVVAVIAIRMSRLSFARSPLSEQSFSASLTSGSCVATARRAKTFK